MLMLTLLEREHMRIYKRESIKGFRACLLASPRQASFLFFCAVLLGGEGRRLRWAANA